MLGERFWAKVSGGDVGTCWEWTGSLSRGYGAFNVKGKPRRAHRLAYEDLRAPIPVGLQIDHLCRNRACVNPWHLEPVTNAMNTRRGTAGDWARIRAAALTACVNGHSWAALGAIRVVAGKRVCRACAREKQRRASPPTGRQVLGPLRVVVERIGTQARLARLECGHIRSNVWARNSRVRCAQCEEPSKAPPPPEQAAS